MSAVVERFYSKSHYNGNVALQFCISGDSDRMAQELDC